MAKKTLNRLRAQISEPSESARAVLVHELVSSLDGVRDGAERQAWDNEIMRRMAQAASGGADLLTRDEFHRRLRSRIGP